MARGFKTGGRTVGTLNKRTEAMLEEITSTGETPLQYMLRVMRDPEAPAARRDAMAIAAAPYVHSKLPQVDAIAEEKQHITEIRFLTEEEWLARRGGNSRLLNDDVSDAVVVDDTKPEQPQECLPEIVEPSPAIERNSPSFSRPIELPELELTPLASKGRY